MSVLNRGGAPKMLQRRPVWGNIRLGLRRGVILVVFISAILGTHLPAAPDKTLYYGIAAVGGSGGRIFRTVFLLMNEADQAAPGTLSLFSANGGVMDVAAAASWVGSRGSFELTGGQASFLIPPRSSLEIGLAPSKHSVGWAQLQFTGELAARAFFQEARLPPSDPLLSSPEHNIEVEAEIFPTTGLKEFAFPVFHFLGLTSVSTSFSLVNLSAAPGTARLTLRPDNTRTIQLEPGQLVADYFDGFWQVVFPAIFPLRFSATAEVSSDVPLAASVFRTKEGFSLSGVSVVARRSAEQIVESSLGAPVRLAINQTALFRPDNLKVTFWNVTEDSRCPVDAVCIQAGWATVALRVSSDGANLGEFLLSTREGRETASTASHSIRLAAVEPAPVASRRLSIADYRVIVTVTHK
ncbi:MAG: hypothetical protein HYX74_05940 [Acidobacteria bacterium]|nr:hypothetical protein [Acidobacteriota bacterium]